MIDRIVGYVVFALVAFGVAAYLDSKHQPMPAGVHVDATPAPEVGKVGKDRIDCVPVVVYKPAAKDTLKLPPSASEPEKRVVAATRTPADERPHTVTTLLDTSTGKFTSYDRAEPLPWLAPNTKTDVGAFFGYRNGEQAVRIEARQEVLQIKALHLGAVASADIGAGDTDTFVGIGAWARW